MDEIACRAHLLGLFSRVHMCLSNIHRSLFTFFSISWMRSHPRESLRTCIVDWNKKDLYTKKEVDWNKKDLYTKKEETCAAYPTCSDFFKSCFKAQSSKLERLFPLKHGKRDVWAWALSFDTAFETVTAGGIHGWSGAGLEETSIHQKVVFCIFRFQSIRLAISGDNPNVRMYIREKTHDLLRLANVLALSSTRVETQTKVRHVYMVSFYIALCLQFFSRLWRRKSSVCMVRDI